MTAKEGIETAMERQLTIKNKLGLHARAAAMFRECASKFKSEIFMIKDNQEVNAKSLLGLIALGAAQGTRLKVVARGEDAEAALDALERLVDRLFEEGE